MSVIDPARITAIGEELYTRLNDCDLCPWECGVDRTAGETGNCGMTDALTIASCNLHHGEEPPLSGTRGSGTIFLSGCSLACLYCQNYPISQQRVGSVFSIKALAEKMLELQERGAHNINFVTPDHFIAHIVRAIGMASADGLEIPIVCNSSGWQKTDTVRLLEGIIDVYLVDMRYSVDEIARNCSGALRYKEVNRAAVKEMYRQVGNLKLGPDGIAERGVLIRHLVLPEGRSGSAEIFKYLAEEISPEVYVSLMSQYFPAYRAVDLAGLNRRIKRSEFDKAVDLFYTAGLKNGYIQQME